MVVNVAETVWWLRAQKKLSCLPTLDLFCCYVIKHISLRNENCVKLVENESSTTLSESSHHCTDTHLPIASRKGYYIHCHMEWKASSSTLKCSYWIFLGRKCVRSGCTFKDKKCLQRAVSKKALKACANVCDVWLAPFERLNSIVS